MKKIKLLMTLAGLLLLGNAGFAQEQDPASPRAGNAQHGRDLLLFLGPRPAGGFSPLQQQELNRRVRCAAIRRQIQDELDVEAAGSIGLYEMSELRVDEKENCTPAPEGSGVQQVAPPAPQAPTWQPPKASYAPPPVPQTAAPSPPPASHPALPPQSPASHPASPPAQSPASQPARTVAAGPAYTPAPDYPHDEMAAGHEGVVTVQLVMNPDGTVKAASVAKSCGFPILDAAALNAARTWRIPAAAGRTIDVPLTFSSH